MGKTERAVEMPMLDFQCPAGAEMIDRRHDGIGIDLKMPVEIGNRPGLAKMLDPQGNRLMPFDAADPRDSCRMAIGDRHQNGVA